MIVTFSLPYLALAGTLQRTREALHDRYAVHLTEPNFTQALPRVLPKYLPLSVTTAPRLPDVDDSFVMTGLADAVTVKEPLLVSVPPGVITAMAPLFAPAGTVAVNRPVGNDREGGGDPPDADRARAAERRAADGHLGADRARGGREPGDDRLGRDREVMLATNMVAWPTVNCTRPSTTVDDVSFAQALCPSPSDRDAQLVAVVGLADLE